MTPLYSIPAPHAVQQVHHGALYTPSDVLMGLLMTALMVGAALFLCPGQLRESAAALWAPFRRFLARLHVAVAGLGVFVALFVLEASVALRSVALDLWRAVVQLRRYPADDGYRMPCLT